MLSMYTQSISLITVFFMEFSDFMLFFYLVNNYGFWIAKKNLKILLK